MYVCAYVYMCMTIYIYFLCVCVCVCVGAWAQSDPQEEREILKSHIAANITILNNCKSDCSECVCVCVQSEEIDKKNEKFSRVRSQQISLYETTIDLTVENVCVCVQSEEIDKRNDAMKLVYEQLQMRENEVHTCVCRHVYLCLSIYRYIHIYMYTHTHTHKRNATP